MREREREREEEEECVEDLTENSAAGVVACNMALTGGAALAVSASSTCVVRGQAVDSGEGSFVVAEGKVAVCTHSRGDGGRCAASNRIPISNSVGVTSSVQFYLKIGRAHV